MAAILGTLIGFALLVMFWHERRWFRAWPDSLELTYITLASFMLIWGLTEIASGLFFRESKAAADPDTVAPRLDGVSWAGIVLVSLGAGGLLLVRWDSTFGFLPISLLVVGTGLLVYGVKRFLDRLLRRRIGPRVTQRVGLTKPGAVCLVIAILLLTGGYLGPSNMLVLIFAGVVGPFVMNGWYAFSMIRRLTVERAYLRQIVAGEPLTVTLSIKNRKRRMSSWLMIASDTIKRIGRNGTEDALVAEAVFPRVPSRSTSEATYRVRLMRRGRYRLGPVRVRSKFPLGLVERSLHIDMPDELIVAPRLGRLTDRWHAETASADELVQRQRPRRGTFPDEFEKLRTFRYGDNPRLIHWRTSARQNMLMIREYHEVRDRDLLVLLDLAMPRNDEESQRRVELAVSLAATICVDQFRRSRQSTLGLVAAGEKTVDWVGVAHPTSAEPLLGLLALVEASQEPNLDSLWDFAREHRTATTSGVLITTRPAASVPRPSASNWLRMLSVADQGFEEYFTLE